MARRKPQRVIRNNRRPPREQPTPEAPEAPEAPDPVVDGEPRDDDDDDDDDDLVDHEAMAVSTSPPPPAKRQRRVLRFPPRCRGDTRPLPRYRLQRGHPSRLSGEATTEPWSAALRAQALWLTLPIDASPALRAALPTLDPNGNDEEDKSADAVVGFERVMDDGDVGAVNAALSLQDLVGPAWRAFADVIDANELTMEIVDGDARQPHQQQQQEWRVGIAWRTYVEARSGPLRAVRRGAPAEPMAVVMLWLLVHLSPSPRKWSYPFPRELDALYEAHVAPRSSTTAAPSHRRGFDVHDVYARIDVARQLARDLGNLPPTLERGGALLPTLREYQKAALSWMLEREGMGSEGPPSSTTPPDATTTITRFVRFLRVVVDDQEQDQDKAPGPTEPRDLLYDPFSGQFVVDHGPTESETAHALVETRLDRVRGGILADEMGLGKTVEVIALVLSHPAPLAIPAFLGSHRAIHLRTPQDPEHQGDEEGATDAMDEGMDLHCICGSDEDCEGGWVQCDACGTWHHRLCTGYDPKNPAFTIESRSFEEPTGLLTPGAFLCYHCQATHRPVLRCKTTLIVSPEAIHSQWESELTRHVRPGTLRLLRYPGVRAIRSRLEGRGPSAEWRMLANMGLELASYDIVLTTYEVLSADLHHLPNDAGTERRSSMRRRRRRYGFIASPLAMLHFWRVCMDEAQVGVENVQLKAALTVAELRTTMTWAVTGTPFSTQLCDVFGCFKFLKLAPFDDPDVGQRHFESQIEFTFAHGAIERLLAILLHDSRSSLQSRPRGGGLLWRTNKRDVFAQLGLPPQTHEVVWCRFSDVERVFYDDQEKLVIAQLEQRLRQQQLTRRETLSMGETDEDQEVTDALWHHVLLLRQICCHPQVGRIMDAIGGGRASRRRGPQTSLNPMLQLEGGAPSSGFVLLTMSDFLQELIDKCKRECEEAQRKLIAAYNGLAALALVGDDVPSAIIKYLACATMIRANWTDFRADLLPRLHVLQNMSACVRRAFDLPSTAAAEGGNGELGNANPRQDCLIPELPALCRSVTSDGIDVSNPAIATECKQLEAAAEQIRRFYLNQVDYAHTTCLQRLQELRRTVDDSLSTSRTQGRRSVSKLLCSSSLWWLEVLELLQSSSLPTNDIQQLVDRVRARILSMGTKWGVSFVSKFTNIHGFMMVLTSELTEMNSLRSKVLDNLEAMSANPPTAEDISLSGNCKKCRDGRSGPVCVHCKFYLQLERYRLYILGIEHNANPPVLSNPRGHWSIYEDTDENSSNTSTTASTSLVLDCFRELATAVRTLFRSGAAVSERDRVTKLIQDGLQQETDLWSSLMKEWTSAKRLFQAQHQRLGAFDELEMALMQIRLRYDGEVISNPADKLYKLEASEVPVKAEAFELERIAADSELRQKQSHLRYLRHLQAAGDNHPATNTVTRDDDESSLVPATGSTTDDTRPNGESRRGEACVVCWDDLGDEYSIFPCAHVTCTKCSTVLANRRRSSNSIRCPTCRQVFSNTDCRVVRATSTQKPAVCDVDMDGVGTSTAAKDGDVIETIAGSDADVKLSRGGISSKIDAMLRRVLSLARKDAVLKALVFTQWQDMMTVIAAALQQNGIKCFTYTGKKQFPRVLQQFKLHSEPSVLTLPFKIGANGLNIVEATEVLLIEPLLNSSIEAQAINRIHRIGQTKQTRVHRFVVESSVEEQIHWLTTSSSAVPVDASEADNSLVVGRQEKEKLTLSELSALLQSRSTSSAIITQFWEELVVLDGRPITRRDACSRLEQRYAAECRRSAPTNPIQSVPRTQVANTSVNIIVARELLQLPLDGNDLSSPALRNFVKMLQSRIISEAAAVEELRDSSAGQISREDDGQE